MGTNGPWHHQMCYHRLPQQIKIKPISLHNIDVSHKCQLQKPTDTNTQPTQIIRLYRNQLSLLATTENTSSLNYNKLNKTMQITSHVPSRYWAKYKYDQYNHMDWYHLQFLCCSLLTPTIKNLYTKMITLHKLTFFGLLVNQILGQLKSN